MRAAHQGRTRPPLAVVRARTAKQAPIQPMLSHRLQRRAQHVLNTQVRLRGVHLAIAKLDTPVLGVIAPPVRRASTKSDKVPGHVSIAQQESTPQPRQQSFATSAQAPRAQRLEALSAFAMPGILVIMRRAQLAWREHTNPRQGRLPAVHAKPANSLTLQAPLTAQRVPRTLSLLRAAQSKSS